MWLRLSALTCLTCFWNGTVCCLLTQNVSITVAQATILWWCAYKIIKFKLQMFCCLFPKDKVISNVSNLISNLNNFPVMCLKESWKSSLVIHFYSASCGKLYVCACVCVCVCVCMQCMVKMFKCFLNEMRNIA